MSEAGSKPGFRWRLYFLLLTAAASGCVLATIVYINTDSFQTRVRGRLIAQVERITGGRAEVGSIHTIPFRLQVEVRNITVHGSEPAIEIPLAHADSITARLKLSSLLRSELSFYEVILEQPVIHIAFYSDGSSNVPKRVEAPSSQTAMQKLFALSINRLEVRRGQILWGDRTIPLDLDSRDISLALSYFYLRSRYDGHLAVGWVETKLPECSPFAWAGTADFSFAYDSASISSLRWSSGHSSIFAQAQIMNFHDPRFHGVYDAHLDLAEAGAISRHPNVRAGTLDMKGSGDGSLTRFSTHGQLNLQDLILSSQRGSLARAALTADYSVTDQQFKLAKLQGKILGGSVSGEAEANHWLAPDQNLAPSARKALDMAVISAARPLNKDGRQPAKAEPLAIQSGLVALRLRDISAEETMQALGQWHRVPDFNLAGSTSGTIVTRWKGTRRDSETRFNIDVAPPSQMASSQLPLTAHAAGEYDAGSGKLDLTQFALATPTSHLQASGTLSSASALRLSVTTSSLADWLPLVEAIRGPALIPAALQGRAAFSGNLSGSVFGPQLSGNLQIENFDVRIPATGDMPQLNSHWDSLATSVQLSFDAVALHSANLRRDDTSAEFDASAALQHGHFTPDSQIAIRAKLQNANVAVLQSLAGYHYPIAGRATVFLQAAGRAAALQGEGQLHLTDASVYGEAVQQFDANFQFDRGDLALDNIHLFHDDSIITGNVSFNPTNRSLRLNLSGKNLDLGRIRQLQSGGLPIEGRADFTIAASGTPDFPHLTADLQLHRLALDRELSGELNVHASTQGKVLHLTAASRLSRGTLQMDGDIQLQSDSPADFLVLIDGVDLDALWRAYLGSQLTSHSAVAGTVHMRGPIFLPSRWVVDGDLNALAIEVQNVKLRSQEPVRFSIANQSLNIHRLHLLGEGTDFSGHGSLQLTAPYTLALAADGHLAMSLLSSVDSDVTASGLVGLNMTLDGTFADPHPQGRIQFENGSLSYANLPSGLSELTGALAFTRDRIHIETLTARSGGGTLALLGDATYLNHQLNFNLSANGRDVRLRYPPGVSSTADASLHWVGTRSASTVTGEITVNKIGVTPGFDFSSYLDRGRQGSPLTVANSALYNIKLDIHVQTAPELQMRTAIARLSGDADLRLRGSVARPAILGRVDILEGQATFHGTRYTLERGDIDFTNPVSIEPQLNLQASTHVRNYDLNITITGTPDHGLNLNYRSEPPLPKSDIIALLALGRTGDESAQLQEQSGQSTFTDQATALILNEALDSTVNSRIQRLFGASNIKIDPQGLTTETNPTGRGPQVTIEQEFANNLSLTYSTNVAQSSQQIIQGEYYINRNISVVGTRDQNGVVSFDVRVRRRKK